MYQSEVIESQPMNTEGDSKVLVGVITGANGIKGYVRVKTFTDSPEDLFDFNSVFFENGQQIELSLINLKKDITVASIKGVTNRNDAEKLRNTQLYVMRSELEPTDADTYYHADLVGLETRHTTGEKHGVVTDVKNYGSCDILEIRLSMSEATTLFPFKKPFVTSVNLEQGFIEISEHDYDSEE